MELLAGVLSDFGMADDPTGDDVLSIEDITNTFGFTPGSEQAKAFWDTNIDPQVQDTGEYGGKSMEWGEGGRSRYLRDKLIMREGLDPDAAETIVRINYFRKITIINEAGGNPALEG
tara:strand:+ start:98 stop:448 length:351 start_codon:yes stop_codon:yes gene_type:complete